MIMMSRWSNVVDVDVVDVMTMLLTMMLMTQPALAVGLLLANAALWVAKLITLACGSSAEDGLLCNWVCAGGGGVRGMCVLKGLTGFTVGIFA